MGHVGMAGQRYYTIQRVNGNGGNGKGDGVAGPHKHTLEESDRVKRNSVQRFMVKEEKEMKKIQVGGVVARKLYRVEGKVTSEEDPHFLRLRYVNERLGVALGFPKAYRPFLGVRLGGP